MYTWFGDSSVGTRGTCNFVDLINQFVSVRGLREIPINTESHVNKRREPQEVIGNGLGECARRGWILRGSEVAGRSSRISRMAD